MTLSVGERIPDASFLKATPDGPEQVDSKSFFEGRKVVLFSVPGPFTPTCSARHLPGYLDKADAIRAKGVDEIACTAVSDPFVMQAWADASGAGDKITMLADGNGEFARSADLTMDASKFGMGTRGQRWSAIVDDGVVKALNVEEPGAFNVSGADHLINQL